MTFQPTPQGGDLLELCQAWQAVINDQESMEFKNAIGREAVTGELSGVPSFHGSRKVIVKTEAAIMLPDGLSMEETVWPMLSFGEVAAKGELGRVSYVRLNGSGLITWMLLNARVMNTQEVDLEAVEQDIQEPDFAYYLPVDRDIQRPLYLPVSLVHYALPAA